MDLATSAVTLTLLLAGAPARQEAKRLFDAATAAYEAGRYDEALADFTASYAALPLAQLLLDIAQCDRQLHRWKDAELQYQRYLSAMPNAPNRAEVSGDLERVRAEQVKAAEAPPARSVEALKLEPPPPQAPMAAVEAPAPRKHNLKGPYWLGGAGILVALAGGSCVIAGEVMAGGDSTSTKGGTTFHNIIGATAVTINNVLLASYVLFGVGAAALAGAGAWAVAAP